MREIYLALLARARVAYDCMNNQFHPERAAKNIAAALNGFEFPLKEIGAAIAREKADGSSCTATAIRDGLRLLDFQRAELEAAIESAARADRQKVARVALLDQANFVQAAKVQKDAISAWARSTAERLGARGCGSGQGGEGGGAEAQPEVLPNSTAKAGGA